eukprot:CAMPEP_0198139052 /NCGR_PEP_ID=MMETSP1443-20131203/2395_1 /TAXON_ID=186043 /ORGANISM="Entomoneis sp., Strain CCMP2396" /LENGTH=283 /DNA_ID=CAMNT_0043801047 /DNA_START=223 /DNA_END=1071 /DNA_ORIENTATION=-
MPSSTTNIRQKEKQRQQHMNNNNEDDVLSCRIIGFYPSPTPPPKGFWGWLLKDIHQAILIESSMYKNQKLLMDFMTKDGELHPVWYNENVKLSVMLGSNIKGEVRIRVLGGKAGRRRARRRQQEQGGGEELEASNNLQQDEDSDYNDRIQQQRNGKNTIEEISSSAAAKTTTTTTTELTSDEETETALHSSKMGEILQIAQSYDINMNLYRNNCRIFCANMEREVERVNQQATRTSSHTVTSTAIISQENNNNNNNEILGTTTTTTSMILTDCRWILRSFFAA